jgi:hypothetical protein
MIHLTGETLEMRNSQREPELGCSLCAFGRGTSAGNNTDPFINDAQLDDCIFCRIANDAQRVGTLLNSLDLFPQQSPQGDYAFVAAAEMFLRSVGHLALSFPRHRVLC